MLADEKTVLLLGGTFNPIHNGHIAMLDSAYEALKPDEVWIMPNGIPAHKEAPVGISAQARLEMVEACLPLLSMSDVVRIETSETHRAEVSFTFQTMLRLHKEYPSYRFIFLIGEDSLDAYDTWVHPEIIAENCELAVCGRDQNSFELLLRKCKAAGDKYHTTFHALNMKLVEVSSTEIRRECQGFWSSYYKMESFPDERKVYDDFQEMLLNKLPEAVIQYLYSHRIYADSKAYLEGSSSMNLEDIRKDLKKRLKGSRYEHTLGVMYTCASLAMRYSYPMQDALYAGLLHDCAKYMGADELIKAAEKHDLPITEAERRNPSLLHAKLGAYYAKERYDVTDPQILHAIRVHTTGIPNMNLLDKILFVADYIEPNRDKAKNLTELRNHAFINLDETITMILRDTLAYLDTCNVEIDETTQATYDFYRKLTMGD